MKKNDALFNPNLKYTPKMLYVLSKFGLGPSLNVTGLEKDILDVISQIDDPRFYDLCECFDVKPSKMEKYLLELEELGLVQYMDAAGKVLLTDLSAKYIENMDHKDTKSERKFRKFIECLTDEELDHFMVLANSFEIDESLLTTAEDAAAKEEAEAESEAFADVEDAEEAESETAAAAEPADAK